MGVQGGNTVKNSLKPRADHGLAGHDPGRDQGRGSEGRPRCERDHLPDEVCRGPRDQQRRPGPQLRRRTCGSTRSRRRAASRMPDAALRNEGRQGHQRSGSGPAGERPAGRQRGPRHLGNGDRTDDSPQHVATWRRGWPSSGSSPESRSCSPGSASPILAIAGALRSPETALTWFAKRRTATQGSRRSSSHLRAVAHEGPGQKPGPSAIRRASLGRSRSARAPLCVVRRSFCMMCARCVSAVRTEMKSCFAISWFVWP